MARIWRHGLPQITLPVRNVRGVTVSPDGTLVVTASADSTVRTWSPNGVLQRTRRQSGPVGAVAFDKEGDLLAAAAIDRVEIWETGSWTRKGTIRTGPGVVDVSFSPDGKRLATANSDGKASIWNVGTGRRELLLRGHRDALTSAAFSPDGTLVVTASEDHDARVFDSRTGTRKYLLGVHGSTVSEAEFSADGRWILTAGPGTAGLWEAETGRLFTLLRTPSGTLAAAVFGGPRYAIYTAGQDGTVRKYKCGVCAPIPGLLELAERRLEQVGRS